MHNAYGGLIYKDYKDQFTRLERISSTYQQLQEGNHEVVLHGYDDIKRIGLISKYSILGLRKKGKGNGRYKRNYFFSCSGKMKSLCQDVNVHSFYHPKKNIFASSIETDIGTQIYIGLSDSCTEYEYLEWKKQLENISKKIPLKVAMISRQYQ